VLVAGPVGIGKSTELARAAKLLENERLPFLVRLDRFENMKRVSVEHILLRIAGQMATAALVELKISLSLSLRSALVDAGVLDRGGLTRGIFESALFNAAADLTSVKFAASAASLLQLVIAEIARSGSRRMVVLIDGLEKLPDGKIVDEVFEALGMISEDVDLVAVLPWSLAFGPGLETMLRTGEHIVILRAMEVQGIEGSAGRRFMLELLGRRLGVAMDALALPEQAGSRDVIESAAVCSGGVPRTFLQLVADAGTYARMRRKSPWPDNKDLADAVADLEDSFRRILRRGDNDAILLADGNDGRELDLERKIRLLAHGVLLERGSNGASVLTIHPLVEPLLNARGASHA